MSDKPLNFNPDDLGAFDRAPNPNDDDLSAFDNASGATVVPAGRYLCRLEVGELLTTKTGKRAYRIRFAVIEPAAHAAFVLWRYYLPVTDPNRTKAALAPLGLRNGLDLKLSPFPEAGRKIICRVLVGIQKDDPTRNDVISFTVVSDDRDDSSAAARFTLPPDGSGEGGAAS